MRILITGGAGFVGSNIAMHLRRSFRDAEIVAMDNLYRRGSELNVPRLHENGITFYWGDIRHSASFPSGPFDFLIECSAEPSVLAGQDGNPDYLFSANVVGAYECVEKARHWGSTLVFLSTSRVYPIERLEGHPWHEEETRFVWDQTGTCGISARGVSECVNLSGRRSLYGFTKLAGEQLIEEYRASFGLKAVVNRCGVIAGPWQFGKVDQGVVSLWVLAHYFNRPLAYIGYGGTGKQVRDVLHIDDLCDLITEQLRDSDYWEGWVGNVSGGVDNSVSLCELTSLCQEITGHTVPIQCRTGNRPNDLRIFAADCTRLFQRTTWRPRRRVREVINDVYAWANCNSGVLSGC
jgi:CDP-paratose 2-epimerase